MREVVVLGVGLHKFGRFPDKTIKDLGRVAILNALNNAGVEFKDIEAAFCGRVYSGMGAGLNVVNEVGMTGIPVVNVEQACSSSSVALRLAYFAIGAGIYDVALVVGFEKLPKGMLRDVDEPGSYEALTGILTPMAHYSLEAKKHMAQYGTTAKQMAMVAVKAHRNGALNSYAQYQTLMTLEEVLNSRMVADPLTLYMCSPTTDGAAAAIVCSKEKAKQYTTNKAISIAGWGAGSPKYQRGKAYDLIHIELTERNVKEAYERAGIGPEDIDVVQLHDASAFGEIIRTEALGLCDEGMGGAWVEQGKTEINGEIPINTDGGLLSRGHPIGATGVAQVAEIFWQLRGEAGPRQVPNNPKTGLCHNSGIGGVNIFIFKR